MELDSSYLIQRFKQPPQSEFAAKAEQVFGGGMMQISEGGWKILQKLFSIDYMGAAEFEYGALPNSFKEHLSDPKKLVAFELAIPGKNIRPNRAREVRVRKGQKKESLPKMPELVTVYVLCRQEVHAEVEERIRELAKDTVRTKERTNFPDALDPLEDYDTKCCGWYDLKNGFFFFTDQHMWTKTSQLFMEEKIPE